MSQTNRIIMCYGSHLHRPEGRHSDLRADRAGHSRRDCLGPAPNRRPAADRAAAGGGPQRQRQHGREGVRRSGESGRHRNQARHWILHRREPRGSASGLRRRQAAARLRGEDSVRRGPQRIHARRTASRARNATQEGSLIMPVTSIGRTAPIDAPRPNVIAIVVLLFWIVVGIIGLVVAGNPIPLVVCVVIGVVLMQSPKVAQQWERAVVLRLGRFVGLRGPGLFWIVPFVDSLSNWIDQRTITTSFAAEQTLTSDTVPVNVDAVLFWMVHDATKAALEVQEFAQAVSWAAQTALRDIIGRTALTDLLKGREKIEEELQQLIDARSNPWGVTVQSVEMRDVVIPNALQDAMSREAQPSREKQARIILGQAELEIAKSFQEAAKSYHDNPTALHLRAMNMLYEGLKEKGALMLIPSSAVESMGMGGLMGAAALAQRRLTGIAASDNTTD